MSRVCVCVWCVKWKYLEYLAHDMPDCVCLYVCVFVCARNTANRACECVHETLNGGSHSSSRKYAISFAIDKLTMTLYSAIFVRPPHLTSHVVFPHAVNNYKLNVTISIGHCCHTERCFVVAGCAGCRLRWRKNSLNDTYITIEIIVGCRSFAHQTVCLSPF